MGSDLGRCICRGQVFVVLAVSGSEDVHLVENKRPHMREGGAEVVLWEVGDAFGCLTRRLAGGRTECAALLT